LYDPICQPRVLSWVSSIQWQFCRARSVRSCSRGQPSSSPRPDRAAALACQYRALRPGGRVAAIVYGPAERNAFFAVPVSVIRRRAQLPPPAAGQPGPFCLGAPGALEDALRGAGFRDVGARTVDAPLRLPSSRECVRFERESFGALHQMLAGLDPAERAAAWQEIADELARFDTAEGFAGPCELVVGWGTK